MFQNMARGWFVEAEDEETLRDTVQAALKQIEEKCYASVLTEKGVKNIRKYGFAVLQYPSHLL